MNRHHQTRSAISRFLRLTPVIALLLATVGCGYPEVSPKTYEISKTLYSSCRLKREADLDKIAELISQAQSADELTEDEAGWLTGIIDQARGGDWESASVEARRILSDQVDD